MATKDIPATTEGQRVRVTLDLSNKMNQELERLAERYSSSKADILRFALDVLTVADRAKTDGMQVGAWSESDGKRTERVFTGL